MGVASRPSALCGRVVGPVVIAFCWLVAAACAQLPPSLSLPAQISVPPPWHSLPLSQSDLGLLFSNSTPFSLSQSLLLQPLAGATSKAGVRASFGPYSVTQLVSSPILPLSPPLTASLLSKTVERERKGERGEKFKVRVLFHWRGDPTRGSCVTLHAFKETEEKKATCMTQPPLGLCVISLPLPKDWFAAEKRSTLNQRHSERLQYAHRHRHRHRGRRQWDTPAFLKSKQSHSADQIQLYYSSPGSIANLKLSPPGCEEDKMQHSQKRLYHIGAVTLEETKTEKNRSRDEVGCSDGQEQEELRVDPNVVIGYRRGPVRAGQPIGVSVSVRSNFTGDFVVIRLKVKKGLVSLLAQPSLASDFWAVTLERSTGSKHNIISIICLRAGSHTGTYSPTVLQEVACLSVDGLQKSFGVAMTVTAQWWVEYSGRNNHLPPHGGVMNTFSFTDRDIVGIAPITESSTIINTAILTSQPVSLPVIVLAVEHDGKVSDVTAAVTCRSTNEDIVKVSSDCSALFVDGSESGVGSTCMGVEFYLGTLSGALCLSVWAPIVPLVISLSDPVLNAIEGWTYYTESGCSPVFQRSTVQVLAQFAAQPSAETGQLTYMLGSPDWFIDVTELVRDWLKVEKPRVAALDKHGYLVGFQPGVTSIQVVSDQWDGVLGSCDVIVSADHVTPGDLSVQLVGGLSLSVKANPAHPSVVTATVTAHNTLYNHGQEASLSFWLQFSDDTASLVSAFSSIPFSLRLSSMAETVVVVTPAPSQRVIAQGDGGGPLLKAELLVSTCQPTSNSIEGAEPNARGGGGTKRLAKGSGWVRVNLDLELRPVESEEQDFEMLEISEVLLESEKGLYNHFGDSDGNLGNSSSDYGDSNVSLKNDLERAVLTPNHEGSGVYFSPGMERERGEGKSGERELEVGVGAVLSLLCLSMLLFLINCLPCALRERGRRRRNK
ncbi:transmembrane protein 132C [Megalops cyprinoides]|uniref:transmembrane protein 132C n=1 Tax=Megalops cyprinoides TaxID=118141 RepID=UPI00186546B7|nr:transmembrane protein 132C [Megalops cyprinoides]